MRRVIHGDAHHVLPMLTAQRPFDALITSLPDASELGDMPADQYERWLKRAAQLCLGAVLPDGVCIFFQTDRKRDSRWVSKSSIIIGIGARLLWHKVVVRSHSVDLFRPGYSHLLAFSARGLVGPPSADVLTNGPSLWKYGMGLRAAKFAVSYARRFGGNRFVDPFCGYGTLLAIAEHHHFDEVVGIDIDAAMCRRAMQLSLPDVTQELWLY